MESTYLVPYEKLVELGKKIFMTTGLNSEDAQILCESLVRADMKGIKSHGMVRVPDYMLLLEKGIVDAKAKTEVVKETPVSLVLDAGNAMGSVASHKACVMTRNKAKKVGLAYTVVFNSNHNGAGGYWSNMLAGEDMIGFAASDAIPVVAPPNGIGRGIGSNPFSYSFPAQRHPNFCLDISVGCMAQGKIWEYKRLNKPLPENFWIGPDGEMTTDPNQFDINEYIMMPFGGHKGFGLGIAYEAMTSLLAGRAFPAEFKGFTKEMERISHCFFAIDISIFTDLDGYRKRASDYFDYIHALPVKPGAPSVMIPGEPEAILEKQSLKEGVRIATQIVDNMTHIAKEQGIDLSEFVFTRTDK